MEYLNWLSSNAVPLTIVAGGGIISYIKYKNAKKEEDIEKVGRVSQVLLYPFKSARPTKLGLSLLVDQMGMQSNDQWRIRDRSWMVALETGSFISMRAEPKLSLILPMVSPCGEYLMLSAPGMSTLMLRRDQTLENSDTLQVNVWGLKSEAVHCGKEAAEWISEYLGKPGHIIVYHNQKTMPGRQVNTGPYGIHAQFGNKDKIAFADVSPILLMSESSVKDLISKLGDNEHQVSCNNFRGNIYIDGPEPYEEDEYDTIYIGDKVVLKNTIMAQRCTATTVNQFIGKKNEAQQPLNKMASYRPMIDGDPCLGLFMSVLQGGEVKVGDPVFARKKKRN